MTNFGRTKLAFLLAVGLLAVGLLPSGLTAPARAQGAEPAANLTVLTPDIRDDQAPGLFELIDGDVLPIGRKVRLRIDAEIGVVFSVDYQSMGSNNQRVVDHAALGTGNFATVPSSSEWFVLDGEPGPATFTLTVEAQGIETTQSVTILLAPPDIFVMAEMPRFPGPLIEFDRGGEFLRIFGSPFDRPRLEVSAFQTLAENVRNDVAQPATAFRGPGTAVYELSVAGVVIIVTEDGIGTGSIISADGLVVTNHHVIDGEKWVGIYLKPSSGVEVLDSHLYYGEVIRVDKKSDLALVQIENPPANLTVLSIGSTDALRVADGVHAIGHPRGEVWTYTQGIVSQLRPGYEWVGDNGAVHLADVVQTQTPINPGNSGGPLLNDDHELIGVNSFGASESVGLNFAISTDNVRALLSVPISAGPAPAKNYSIDWKNIEIIDIDADKDGIPDTFCADLDGDGEHDFCAVDEDQDGEPEYALIDENQNGIPELKIVLSSESEFWVFDYDEDGVFDAIGRDTNGDGEIDKVERL